MAVKYGDFDFDYHDLPYAMEFTDFTLTYILNSV